jgi:hypothetical protein
MYQGYDSHFFPVAHCRFLFEKLTREWRVGGDFFVDAWSIGDAMAWRCRRMLEKETVWGTIEEKPVRLSFSLSFPYCSLFVHNFLRCES